MTDQEKKQEQLLDVPHNVRKSTGQYIAELAGRVLQNGGKCTRVEATAMAASLLTQYERGDR